MENKLVKWRQRVYIRHFQVLKTYLIKSVLLKKNLNIQNCVNTWGGFNRLVLICSRINTNTGTSVLTNAYLLNLFTRLSVQEARAGAVDILLFIYELC